MKKLLQGIAKQGLTILVAGITSYCVANAVLCSKVDDYVADAYEKEATKFRAEFEIICTHDGRPAEITDIFSKGETFKPSKMEQSVLESKVGFKYEVDNVVCKKTGYKTRLGTDHEACFGQEYIFTVDNDIFDGAKECLSIYNFTGEILPTTDVHLYDDNHDGRLDRIRIKDDINNTELLIKRDREGNLKYDNINEEGARQLYELYTLKFNTFKIDHGIDQAVLDYQPKLEIKELKPPK